jgi:hypothetical protein
VSFSVSSRGRLTGHDVERFPGDTLFSRLGRAVCSAGCLPRKELFEAWHIARRVRRLFRGGRVVDLGAGHGLLGAIMLILDDSSASALAVDRGFPSSTATLHAALIDAWPRLEGRITFERASLDEVDIHAGDVVVASHACGSLTDCVLDGAVAARARVAVLTCCHHFAAGDAGGLTGWIDRAVAIDVVRAMRLRQQGYRVWTQTIPAAITPMNRLLMGAPQAPEGALSDYAAG